MKLAVKAPETPHIQPKRRVPGEERRALIVAAAAELFAERGFDGSTRDIAKRLGVTQPLLYRYFATKEALIKEVIDRVLAPRWRTEWAALLADESMPPIERITEFYIAYFSGVTKQRMRMWLLAAMAGHTVVDRLDFPLMQNVLAPIVRCLRRAVGLSAEAPVTRGERELAMALHGGLMFMLIRKHVYGMRLPDRLDDVIALHVESFVEGVLPTLRRLHAEPGRETLRVRILR